MFFLFFSGLSYNLFCTFFASKLLFEINYVLQIPYTISLPEKIVLTENESRQWRKKNYYRISELENTTILITGHTETDNLEKNFNLSFFYVPCILRYISFPEF